MGDFNIYDYGIDFSYLVQKKDEYNKEVLKRKLDCIANDTPFDISDLNNPNELMVKILKTRNKYTNYTTKHNIDDWIIDYE